MVPTSHFLLEKIMLLKLGKTDSPNNVIFKNVSGWVELDIRLKEDVDILMPVLVLRGAGLVLRDFNYAHIPDLGRSYFIRGVESLNGKLWRLELEVDVLESYRSELLDCPARLYRGIRPGDYTEMDLDLSSKMQSFRYESSVTLDPNVKTNILTVVSGGD